VSRVSWLALDSLYSVAATQENLGFSYINLVGTSNRRLVNFVIARLTRMVCKKDTRVYTGLGRISLRPVQAACALALSLQ
jgi:hypothetical protein